MNRNFDHVTKRSAVSFENGRNVVDRLLGLLFNLVACQLAGCRIHRSSSRHEEEVSGAPSLRIGSLRWRSSLALHDVLGHLRSSPVQQMRRAPRKFALAKS